VGKEVNAAGPGHAIAKAVEKGTESPGEPALPILSRRLPLPMRGQQVAKVAHEEFNEPALGADGGL